MAIQWTSNPEASWPDGADGVSVTPSGTAGVFGSWVTIVDPTTVAAVLSGIALRTTSTPDIRLEIQIGVAPSGSAADSESPIAAIPLMQRGQSTSSEYTNLSLPFSIPVDLLPVDSRVSARVRVNTTSVTPYVVAALYYEKPIVGNLLISTQPIKAAPGGTGILVQLNGHGTPWANGAWATIIDPTSTEQVVDGVIIAGDPTQIELELGTGASPSPVSLHRGSGTDLFSAFCYLPLMHPLDVIGNGVKVSGRIRHNQTTETVRVAYTYREKPI